MPQSAVTAPVFTPENSPAVVKTHPATPIDRPPQQPASRSPKSTAAASPAPNVSIVLARFPHTAPSCFEIPPRQPLLEPLLQFRRIFCVRNLPTQHWAGPLLLPLLLPLVLQLQGRPQGSFTLHGMCQMIWRSLGATRGLGRTLRLPYHLGLWQHLVPVSQWPPQTSVRQRCLGWSELDHRFKRTL